jgi:streptogramin lyase
VKPVRVDDSRAGFFVCGVAVALTASGALWLCASSRRIHQLKPTSGFIATTPIGIVFSLHLPD